MFMLMLFSTRWDFPVASDFYYEIIFKSQVGTNRREIRNGSNFYVGKINLVTAKTFLLAQDIPPCRDYLIENIHCLYRKWI